ncbi:SA1362 family protein [Alkalicoccus urumqiensis]|uniref:Uncharacterized protein n=1 Tax=Alkalicoccus urumqiensis TaxID=1548213 RepID=A0A2P6MKA6_ALKUR|nr:SA1362 family protein [Alkalicoccus urumqiensis]PRO66701.1 hypothetical protein C6I21_01875 [Alkalicoccus urumqiensis]
MKNKRIHPLLIVLFALAALGIGTQLVQSPGQFITGIFVTIGVVTLLILVVKKFIQPRMMQQRSGFEVPVKNGRPVPGKQKPKPKNRRRSTVPLKTVKQEKRSPKPLVKRQSDVKLTVIEGRKNMKKKSRALF